jgi:hypothetical protein
MLAAHEMFAFMSPTLAREIVDQLHTHVRDTYRTTLHAVAEFRKVRPLFLERKPRADQYLSLIESLSRPKLELHAIAVLQTWLLKCESALLADFLNALEIKHENGAVDDLPSTMDDAKLAAAVEGLLSKHPRREGRALPPGLQRPQQGRLGKPDQAA